MGEQGEKVTLFGRLVHLEVGTEGILSLSLAQLQG